MGVGLEDNEVRQILADADADGDGLITCEEFRAYLESVFPDDEKTRRKGGRRRRSVLYDVRKTAALLPVHGNLVPLVKKSRGKKSRGGNGQVGSRDGNPGKPNSNFLSLNLYSGLPKAGSNLSPSQGSPTRSFFGKLKNKLSNLATD